MFGELLDSTNHKSSSSQFPTVSPVHSLQACCVEHLGQTVDDAWQIIDAGDRELQTQAQSSRRDNLKPGAEDTMDLIATLYCTIIFQGFWSSVHLQLSVACFFHETYPFIVWIALHWLKVSTMLLFCCLSCWCRRLLLFSSYVCLCVCVSARFFVESIAFLEDIKTVEMFYLQAQSLISQVSQCSVVFVILPSLSSFSFQQRCLCRLRFQ